MEVTDVRVFPVREERLKAYVTITFDNCFVVRDIKVIDGHSGLFVAMPAKKRKDGTFQDTAHPLNAETREMIEAKVLAEYSAELSRSPYTAHVATGHADVAPRNPDNQLDSVPGHLYREERPALN